MNLTLKDFIIWRNSFPKYLELFQNFKNELISGESFVDEFFDLFNLDKKLLENFVFNSENLKNLNINSKSFGLVIFLDEISLKLDFFEGHSEIRLPGQIDEIELKSYITEKCSEMEVFFNS